jgi:F0F1-type ATP synthase assembly protein I
MTSGADSNDRPTGKDSRAHAWFLAYRVSYIGIFFGVAICIGFFVGQWADKKFHTAPWLSMVGLLLGIISSFSELIRIVMRYQRELDRRSKEAKETPR